MKFNCFLRMSVTVAAFASMLWCGGCSDAPAETPTEPQIEINTPSVIVSRRGVDQNGNYAYIRVSSNVYWQAFYPEEAHEWLTLSALGGDPGTLTVTMEFSPNEEQTERSTIVRLETLSGLSREVTVVQRGTGDVIVLMNDGFAGTYTEGTDIVDYIPYGLEGLDYQAIRYEGTAASISMENPSFGYEGASGGNNILLKGTDAVLCMTGVDALRSQHFDFNFGVCCDETFREEDLALEISCDREAWAVVPYTISQSAEQAETENVTGWQMAVASFTIEKAVSDLYFRLRVVGEKDFRIDDLCVNEGLEGSQVIEFAKPEDPDPKPVETVLWEEHFNAFQNSDFTKLSSDMFAANDKITNSPDLRSDKLTGDWIAVWNATGITSEEIYLYPHAGHVKLGTNSKAGDMILPAIETLTQPTDLTITFNAVRVNSDRKKVYDVNIQGDGEAVEKQFEVENYAYPDGAETYEQRANYQQITLHVIGATASTRIQIKAAESGSQIVVDDFMITGAVIAPPTIEGLPVIWSFPDDAETTGLVQIDNNSEPRLYRMFSDDNKDAYIDVQIANSKKANANTFKTNLEIETYKTNGACVYSFVKDDSFLFTVPVKNLSAGTKLRLCANVSGSGKGSRFLILEYSTDNQNHWTAVNTKTEKFASTDGTTVAEHDITYTILLSKEANKHIPVDETFTVDDSLSEGKLFVRLRVCDAFSLDMTRNNTATANGLNRLYRTLNGDPVSISVVGD